MLFDVGDDDHAEPLLRERPHQREHVGGGGGIERRGRLVQQHELGLVGERAGEGHALALAAGEITGGPREDVRGEAHAEHERFEGRGRERRAREPRSGRHVVGDRALEHRWLLGHVADAASENRGRDLRGVEIAKLERPRVARDQRRHGAQQRGLAAPRGALDDGDFPGVDAEIGACDDRSTFAKHDHAFGCEALRHCARAMLGSIIARDLYHATFPWLEPMAWWSRPGDSHSSPEEV